MNSFLGIQRNFCGCPLISGSEESTIGFGALMGLTWLRGFRFSMNKIGNYGVC